MSKVTELEEKLSQAKRQVLKEKYSLEDELEQLKQDKFSYKRKGDFSALEKANIKEKELKSKLNSLKNRIPSLEAQLKKAKEDEQRQKTRVENKRKQVEKRNTTKGQMNSILRLMRQGKTRSQAAQSVGVPLSRVSHWVREGKQGVTTYSHFYHEITSIEKDREIRKQNEINRQNRIREMERQRKLTEERQKRERERKEILRKQKSEQNIQNQMNTIVSQMKSGKTRAQAASYAGVSIKTVDEWFDKGWKRQGKQYIDFYNKVNTQEIRQKKENKPKTTVKPSKDNVVKQMDEVLSLMRKGSSRSEAAQKLNISIITVNNWYNKGMNGDLTYIKFYNNVKSIESTRNKYKSGDNSKPPKVTYSYSNKSKDKKSNLIKCPKCNKYYNKSLDDECPNCRKSSALTNVKYCKNCGKKLDVGSSYCSSCGKSVNENKKTTTKTTSASPISNDSMDWTKCCFGGVVVVIIIILLRLFI